MSHDNYQTVKVDIKEIEEQIRKNKKERAAFIDFLANWVKSSSNLVWSTQQKKFLE